MNESITIKFADKSVTTIVFRRELKTVNKFVVPLGNGNNGGDGNNDGNKTVLVTLPLDKD